MIHNRRSFVKGTSMALASGLLLPDAIFASFKAPNIRVLVWDERSDTQKETYDNFLGNCIADYLTKQPGLSVASVALDDPGQGIPDVVLDKTDVLIWWGHVRQAEITPETGKNIVKRISNGTLSLIALHSAHWSTPFVEAMNEITVRRALADKSIGKDDIHFIPPDKQYTVPKYDSRVTPYTTIHKFPDGHQTQEVYLPICCFPAYRNDGMPSTVTVKKKDHPVMKGLPASFQITKTEMYNEPFHVPEPDEILFEECWAPGEWFRSGMLWQLGKGKVFYFRPGHETYPVFKEKWPLQIIHNAVSWITKS